MIGKSKYIRTEQGFFIFPATTKHSSMAVGIVKSDAVDANFFDSRVISAGFVQKIDGNITCYGESVSLNIQALPEDSKLLQNQLGI